MKYLTDATIIFAKCVLSVVMTVLIIYLSLSFINGSFQLWEARVIRIAIVFIVLPSLGVALVNLHLNIVGGRK